MEAEITVYIPVDTLHSFMRDVFIASGVPAEDATISADVLIASDLAGIKSHGIGRLKMYYDRIKSGQHKPVTQFEIVRQSPTTAVVDGHHGMGMVIGRRAMQMAIDNAKVYGMGSVAVRNSTHFGIDGYYARMASDAGMIGMSFTNARPASAPTFGVQPMLGTNPIAFGCPTDEPFPYLFDAATPITQRGKFEVLARAGQPSNSGWVIREDGQPETDAQAVLNGLSDGSIAMLPLGGAGEDMGGHKGYNLATIVEILSSSLQTGAFMYGLLGIDEQGNKRPYMLGHFFMAINIEAFVELDTFKHTTGSILRQLRNSRKAPGQPRIYTAGEKEYEMEKIIQREGVAIVPALQSEMLTMLTELNLTQYKFPFYKAN